MLDLILVYDPNILGTAWIYLGRWWWVIALWRRQAVIFPVSKASKSMHGILGAEYLRAWATSKYVSLPPRWPLTRVSVTVNEARSYLATSTSRHYNVGLQLNSSLGCICKHVSCNVSVPYNRTEGSQAITKVTNYVYSDILEVFVFRTVIIVSWDK